ncbi:hypothetical protein TKK_0015943 [Trichogramma kaykai]
MYALVIFLALGPHLGQLSMIQQGTGQCYDSKDEYYPLMSTRTAYELIYGNMTRPPGCEPMQVWGTLRHGTRYLREKETVPLKILAHLQAEIVRNFENGRSKLCAEDVEIIKGWKWNEEQNDNEDVLTKQGYKELFDLAKRLQAYYPELLRVDPVHVNRKDFELTATTTQRTQASLTAFMEGLAGNISLLRPEIPLENDTLLLMHKHCPTWKRTFKEQNLFMESVLFSRGPLFEQVEKNVQERLGFEQSLNYSTISAMQEMCRFELAWNPQNVSAWCTVFSKNDLKIFEYKDDLNNYYCCGPGRAMSTKLGCEMMSNMYRHFEDLVRSNFTGQAKGVFYFTHTVALRVLMTALKMHFMPVNMTSQNFATMQDRIFRSSLQGAFAGNVIAVFYRCSGQNKVVFYVSERVLEFPGCDRGVCDWEYLKKLYAPQVAVCNLDWCFQNETEKNIWLSGKSVPSGLGDDEPEKSTTRKPRLTEAPPAKVPFNISDYEPEIATPRKPRFTEAPTTQMHFNISDYEPKKSSSGKPRPTEAPPAQVHGGAEKIQVGLVTFLLAVLLAARNNV